MIFQIQKGPSPTPFHRVSRIQWLSFGVMGTALMVFWNPLEHGGPVICPARLFFAIPCPACGVTRGASLTLHGHPISALYYNPLIWFVLLGSVWFICKWTVEYLSNQKIVLAWEPPFKRWGKWFLFLVVLANWTYLLIYRREDDFASSWTGQLITWLFL